MANRKLIRTSYEHRRKSLAAMATDGHQSRNSPEASGRRFSIAGIPDEDLATFGRRGSESNISAALGGGSNHELHQKLIRRTVQPQRPSPKREKSQGQMARTVNDASSSKTNLTWTLVGVLVLIAFLFIMVVVVSKSLLKYLKGK